ncbi:unnamed protein product [Protopolystoma xenopodis]|uniref:Uncharacterized protein n=1 Tax=Protopolystoma xenopodis TaxID=117903 RepID=A0A448WI48_9PLAT|nr:unnamed protein product [Protopolystoma xenopodis]
MPAKRLGMYHAHGLTLEINMQTMDSVLGYLTRRLAVETRVPLLTDVKLTRLLVDALWRRHFDPNGRSSPSFTQKKHSLENGHLVAVNRHPRVHLSPFHCLTLRRLFRLPGLIDIHVHVRYGCLSRYLKFAEA